jgi:hypothetical protein
MKLLTMSMFALVFVAGCDKQSLFDGDRKGRYATLYFDKSVNQMYMKRGSPVFTLYPDNIIEALRKLGVQVEGLDFQLDEEDSTLIHIAIKDESYGPDQQRSLRAALEDVLRSKQRPAFSGHVMMDPDSPDFKVSKPQLYERSENGVYVYPRSEMRLQVKYKENFNVYYGKSEFYCHVTSRVKHDLPFKVAVLIPGNEGDYFKMTAMTWYKEFKDVAMKFDNPDIRQLLSEGRVKLGVKSHGL